jgi:multidrug resistance efflux pump
MREDIKSRFKDSLRRYIKIILEQDDKYSKAIKDALVQRDTFDLKAKKIASDKAKNELNVAKEKLSSVMDSGKEDTSSEQQSVKSAEEKVKSANDNVMATQKKLDATKKGGGV